MTGPALFRRDPTVAKTKAQGITSLCSAHPLVIRAGLEYAARTGTTVLIEATCNQVNHQGGYTGMTPADFAARVFSMADAAGLAHDRIILGGDHLGPNPWRKQTAEAAMAEAEKMVAAYIEAGFSKIHLDASMGCLGEPEALDDAATAGRAARLAKVAEEAARRSGRTPPVYIIGTEVPPPGGADHVLTAIEPTSAKAARTTIAIHRSVFADAGLSDAFARVVGVVVQPGVEFGNENVILYDRDKAKALCAVLDDVPDLAFEAHSTDYQGRGPLRALVEDGFAILKVGPELTFALREALYGLDLIAGDLFPDRAPRALHDAMETLMLEKPGDWARHYGGTVENQRIQRHYSYSDRIRYYWNQKEAEAAVSDLFARLSGVSVPVTLFRQHLPHFTAFAGTLLDPAALAVAAVGRVVEDYAYASTGRAGGGAPLTRDNTASR